MISGDGGCIVQWAWTCEMPTIFLIGNLKGLGKAPRDQTYYVLWCSQGPVQTVSTTSDIGQGQRHRVISEPVRLVKGAREGACIS
jgi:hypothetical protein